MAVVYRHIRLDTGMPFYIGIGKDLKRAYSKRGRTAWWQKIAYKSGYEVEILFDNLNYEKAKEKEKEFIKIHGRINTESGILINLTDGGDGALNYKHTEVAKTKMSEFAKTKVGQKNPFHGKNHSLESKMKISQNKIGCKWDDEAKIEMSKRTKGVNKTQEHKDAIRNALKGIPKSKEHIANSKIAIKKAMNTLEMRDYLSKKAKEIQNTQKFIELKSKNVLQFTLDNNFVKEYLNCGVAAKELGVSISSLRHCLLGKSKTCKGYNWKYKLDNQN